jgi:hypothetical protein
MGTESNTAAPHHPHCHFDKTRCHNTPIFCFSYQKLAQKTYSCVVGYLNMPSSPNAKEESTSLSDDYKACASSSTLPVAAALDDTQPNSSESSTNDNIQVKDKSEKRVEPSDPLPSASETTGMAEPPSKKSKKPYLQFHGHRAPRVGDDFQATFLPQPAAAIPVAAAPPPVNDENQEVVVSPSEPEVNEQ